MLKSQGYLRVKEAAKVLGVSPNTVRAWGAAAAGSAIVVPREAVLEDEGRAFVFVHHHGDYFVRRPVVPGRSWGEWVEIVDGLEPSQTLVAEGAFLMKSDVLRSKMGAGCAD